MLAIILMLPLYEASAQDDGFIYGRVTTIEDDVYEGPIRWGKEEAYWTDMFNAEKEDNDNIDYLSREEYEYLIDQKRRGYARNSDSWIHWTKSSWFDDWDWDNERFIHQFNCQFGEIKSIRIRGRDRVQLTFQNGESMMVDGDGYNDIGGKIKVLDQELGTIELSWNRIEIIEFLTTPKKLDEKFGEPLYGTVESEIGSFTGYVQWDHDERVSTDKLDGDTEDGDLSISFGKIKSIERYGYSRSEVEMLSGRKLELRGSNDVNSENRGIIVTVPELGRIDIPWREFDKVTFEEAPGSSQPYNNFSSQEKLEGTVIATNGDEHEGNIVFDLDETYNYEVLQGKDDDIEFIIPFRNIATITPLNYDASRITLKNGDEYRLEDAQDVSEQNEGVVILSGNDPVYVPWDKIKEVRFK